MENPKEMSSSSLPAIAVIADAHFHDLFGNYDIAGVAVGGRAMALRPFANTARSTRVFNESGSAIRHALDDISARGIRHVVLLGDYSDDGQAATMSGLQDLLEEYVHRYAMRFFATPGNHDIFGPGGRHRSKRFLNAAGGHDLVTSNPARSLGPGDDALIVSESMYCAGYPQGLRALANVGYFRSPGDIHWETPFGLNDDPSARRYDVRSSDGKVVRSLMDASYLIEPFAGLWMLMVDANVFVPVDGASNDDEEAFIDSTDAGWNAMLVHKRFVLDWAKSVSERAEKLGKRLVAFSHYPVLDPLDNTRGDELNVLGQTSLLRRIPEKNVGQALRDAGVRVHFSGHLHVNDTARYRTTAGFLINVSVPSLVAFPGAYKIIRFEPGQLNIETVGIGDMALDDGILAQYSAEAARDGIDARRLLEAENYGTFLSEHLAHLVGRRHLRREWPHDLAEAVRALNLADLAVLAIIGQPVSPGNLATVMCAAYADSDMRHRLAACAEPYGLSFGTLAQIKTMTFLGDWYRLRMGSDLGLDAISGQHLLAYKLLSRLYADRATERDGPVQASFGGLLRMFDQFISGLPSRNFIIDLKTGDTVAL
jgi:3',5'-cyclic AMP phosphodiesterase CpdA